MIFGISSEINNINIGLNWRPIKVARWNKIYIKYIKTFLKNMLKKGYLIFPVIGLSNRDKLIHFLKKTKITYKIINKQEWPLPLPLSKKEVIKQIEKTKINKL